MGVHLADMSEVALIASIFLLIDGEGGVVKPAMGLIIGWELGARRFIIDSSLLCANVAIEWPGFSCLQETRMKGILVVWQSSTFEHIVFMRAHLLHFKPIHVLLQMSDVLVSALFDSAPMLVNEILIAPVSLLQGHPSVVGQLGTNLLELLLGDIIDCFSSNKCVLRKLLKQLLGFPWAIFSRKFHKRGKTTFTSKGE
jgi:hypothetical protein